MNRGMALSSLLVIVLMSIHPASGQAVASWVALEADLMAPNAVRINTLDTWVKVSENIDLRLGAGGLALVDNPNPSQPRQTIDFWHFTPVGISYGLGQGFSVEGMIEGLSAPGWNLNFLVDQEDAGWVPGITTVGTARHLAFRWSIPVQEWGSMTLKVGIRGCSEIDIYADDNGSLLDLNYVGRFTPYSTGFFIQTSIGLGDWRSYRWGWRKSRPKKTTKRRSSQRQVIPNVPRNPERASNVSNSIKRDSKISFSENNLDITVENIFVIEGKGQSCRQKSIESGVLDVVGQKLIGPYNVLERQMLDVVLEEQRLAMSGLVFEATAVEAGCLQGADGVVFCQYGCLGEDELLTVKLVDCKTSSQLWVLTGINAAIVDVVEELEKRLR